MFDSLQRCPQAGDASRTLHFQYFAKLTSVKVFLLPLTLKQKAVMFFIDRLSLVEAFVFEKKEIALSLVGIHCLSEGSQLFRKEKVTQNSIILSLFKKCLTLRFMYIKFFTVKSVLNSSIQNNNR